MSTTKIGECADCRDAQTLKIMISTLASVRKKTKTSVVKWYHENNHQLWSSN